ncbi:MAG: flagellar filament capping protein FliD [Pseudomonadota bacterium]
MGISSPGIGSNIDVNGIITKLMAVEAAPINTLDKKTDSFKAKVSAFGALSGAIGTFQSSLTSLSSLDNFQALTSTSNDTSVLVGSATSKALPGTYRVNVTQVAQAQTLASGGYKSPTAAIGLGGSTTVTFALGTVSGGSFGLNGTTLGSGVLTGGITPGALTINNTAIATDGSTRSAKLLADAINAKSATTGVSAKAAATVTSATLFGAAGASTFGPIDTTGGGTYSLRVAGVEIANQGSGLAAGDGVTAASLDAILTGSNSVSRALADANITTSGSAADGTLQFTNADGSNIAITEAVSGTVTGGIGNAGAANTGSASTTASAISLVSANGAQITVGGTAPGAAGLAAGIGGAYLGTGFAQDATRNSGSIVIDSKNNTLKGIRDAINKGNFGVTASIVMDGSANPNHLVLTSSTGAASTMKISLAGEAGAPPDAALSSLLAYDPAGVQNLSQKASAQDTVLDVNGIAVTSSNTSISGAVEGVTLTIGKVGSANLVIAKDNSSLSNSINGFVKAYNDLNGQIKTLSGYDPETKTGGPLLGDSTAQTLQSQIRKQLSESITGLQGKLTTLSQVGIAFQKDGTLMVDGAKLQKAIDGNFNDIAALFAVVGNSSDGEIGFTSSTTATKPGNYAVNITTLASRGTLSSAAALPPTTVIAPGTSWTVALNDSNPSSAANSASVTIPAGSYTPAELAVLLQSSINGVSKFSEAGAAVSATVEPDGSLKVVSNRYGSKSNLAITDGGGSTVASLFGAATPSVGVDVAGTIGGFAAEGDGQSLTGSAGAATAGLKLDIKGDTLGARGDIGFSQGYAYQLNNLSATFLGSTGYIAGRTTGLNSSIKTIAKQRDDFSAKLVDIEARYRKQYTALDTAISSMSTTASFLTQQFAAMSKN